MSDDRRQTHGGLDAETLAAFIDGRLEPREREAVEAHLAECEDCYEVWMEGVESMNTVPASSTSRLWTKRGAWRLAAAAVLIIATGGTLWLNLNRPGNPTSELLKLTRGSRVTTAMLSDQGSWAPRPSALRASVPGSETGLHAAAKAIVDKSEGDTTAEGARVSGVAWLVLGDGIRAVASLRRAVAIDPKSEAAHVDLAAALLTSCAAPCPDNALAALRHSDLALSVSQSSLGGHFNRALALEQLHRTAEAVVAWTSFAQLTTDANWRDEALGRIAELRQRNQ